MASLQQQIRFEHGANSQSLEAIVKAPYEVPEALSLLAHILAISSFWAARVESIAEPFDPWPRLPTLDFAPELHGLRDRWLGLSDCFSSDARVHYQSSDGGSRSNLFSEVLQEVILHGAHHRGQIALTLRIKGVEPPRSTDFIPALRTQSF